MITRYAMFQGDVHLGKLEDFKTAVMDELLPTWLIYPGATAVRVSFATDRDDQAPNVPLIIAIDFASRKRLDEALNSQERLASRAATERVLPGLFTGQILHFVTESSQNPVA